MGRYPANKLMVREPLPVREPLRAPFDAPAMPPGASSGISLRFQRFSPSRGQVAHVFLPSPPLSRGNIAIRRIPFDLHA